ncbi:protein SPA1-RELATED 2 isoform X2 [Silene latifolia]|uniref:protein SPA1-RELATED 2 isoform X2 n=1 Tax=Silene latifolia TaxID=37657 RepID=UPI003D76FDFA
MDVVDMDETTTVSRADDVRAPGKEGEFLRESRNLAGPSDRVIRREGELRRSSVRQFMDLLNGKDSGSTVNLEDTTQNPCTSFGESGEERVQELTLGHCHSGFPMMNEGQMMEEMLNEGQYGQRRGVTFDTGTKPKHPNRKEKSPATSTMDVSTGERAGQNVNLNLNLSTYNVSSESPRDAVSSGGMRMKIISKSTGYPEYFVKNSLKGKGVFCNGPISVGVEGKRQESPCIPSISPSPHGCSTHDLSGSHAFANDGISLREWMKSGKLQKADRMCIFKEILDLVHFLHSDGKVLVDLRPSCFRLLPSREIRYCGRLSMSEEMSGSIIRKEVVKSQSLKRPLEQGDSTSQGNLSRLQHAFSVVDQLEEKWYRTPEDIFGRGCTSSSNIYCLGVLLFELLSNFHSAELHAAAMSDLRHRILPPNFLSENPKEAGFCLWLLHPEPSLRPTASDILQSEVICALQDFCGDDNSSLIEQDEGESELLLHFLMSMKEQKQKRASKLMVDLGCIEADVKELEKRHLLETPMSLMYPHDDFLYARERVPCNEDIGDTRISKNVDHLEKAYFSARSRMHHSTSDFVIRKDNDLLHNRENWCVGSREEEQHNPIDERGAFFDGLCKYARYSKLEVCGTLRNREITNSTNVICSLSFDRDEDYFAAAGVSKKIKIFDFQALCDDSVDIHYPMIEMSNTSKLSCVCWNSYVRNYLASSDYDGIVKLWDASTGQSFSQYAEHEKRAWSVDFSPLDPTRLASGSDDCCVKLWSINEKNCLHTIRNIANVCCVQFSSHSSNLLAFGSADYKIYCYDLRNANVPWCVLGGHDKAVSYVKFVDSSTLVSASTDNTLKLWDLNRSRSLGLSTNACSLTLKGHTNEKNFVGLSVSDGYVACGSETNEVYTYYRSLPMPITSHKFGSIDPITGKETDDENGQFVSSVCWKGKSNQLVAANSTGCIKVLQMV